ncbi:A disintegrin and metalloproteinase with thrombospondin motifs 7 [Eumeta japonica]|uniref:A disintegrin and metalloproteinase with thrombospondin motifs 7 n=1 Tax=Eumeta variegata TaxID=151549 RepID=A0A4C1XE77_EUMVA|nr:A disintegrin and metalloproteinase with thrombospondin motifs 7 [Eumeta japonica]
MATGEGVSARRVPARALDDRSVCAIHFLTLSCAMLDIKKKYIAGLLRTEHGEYWIEPSNQLPTDESEGRSHVIFKRSALSKEDAWHRARQAQNSKTESTSNSGRLNRREMNQNRYNEYKRKRIEDLRRNSSLYNRQQAMKRRFDQRRKITKFNRTLNSLSYENVQRLPSNPLSATANTAAGSASKPQEKRHKGQKNNARPRRRRRRKAKECATKQPPYPWKNKNSGRGFDASEVKELRHNKNTPLRSGRELVYAFQTHRRYPHHHQLSQRNDFYENRRSPRSVSKPQHVEVLLVADTSMTDFHDSKGSLETYLLTIMNMVSSLYMDPSIGNYIKVVVVKIILVVDSASPDLVVSSNADHTLSSFCRWQQKQNPDDDDNPHHHDVAILVTRQDICSRHDAPCRNRKPLRFPQCPRDVQNSDLSHCTRTRRSRNPPRSQRALDRPAGTAGQGHWHRRPPPAPAARRRNRTLSDRTWTQVADPSPPPAAATRRRWRCDGGRTNYAKAFLLRSTRIRKHTVVKKNLITMFSRENMSTYFAISI